MGLSTECESDITHSNLFGLGRVHSARRKTPMYAAGPTGARGFSIMGCLHMLLARLTGEDGEGPDCLMVTLGGEDESRRLLLPNQPAEGTRMRRNRRVALVVGRSVAELKSPPVTATYLRRG